MAKNGQIPLANAHPQGQIETDEQRDSTKVTCFIKNDVKEAIQEHLAAQTQTKPDANRPSNQSINLVFTQNHLVKPSEHGFACFYCSICICV